MQYFLERPDDILRNIGSLLRDFPQEISQFNSIFIESYDFFNQSNDVFENHNSEPSH